MNFSAYTWALAGCLVSLASAQESVVDPFLGEPFRAAYFDAGDGGRYHATLVSYPFGSTRPALDSADLDKTVRPKAAVLYVHGFNDYYFQKLSAEKLDSAGYAFYAIDLHNYGRSLRKGEVIGELRDIASYFPELDSAFARISAEVGDSVPKVLLGHSTGGLVSVLYAGARDNGKNLGAIVLNSPFFEMNQPWIVRDVFTPLLSKIGAVFPDITIPRGKEDNYSISLLKDQKGEWEFDTTLKVPGSIPVDFGWGAAIHNGQLVVQEGMNLVPPVLVMHSSCSFKETEWSEEVTRCDVVLDIDDIRNYGAHLGPDVHLVQVQDGLHDLYLSRKEVRDNAYQVTIKFLDDLFAKDMAPACKSSEPESGN